MQLLKKPILIRTAFADYELTHIIGEGGAGRVYRALNLDGNSPVAIKLLTNSTGEKRKRFKNETGFLLRNKHNNLVDVIDHGMSEADPSGPFYVMPLYDGSLRNLMQTGIAREKALQLFSKILDGVEAAHLLGVTHRDLKPENILYSDGGNTVAVADFGIASFTSEMATTHIETKPTTRLANFTYAAPEQRISGRQVGIPADIWALGLILNELFTGDVPHGNSHKQIKDFSPEFSFLDRIVSQMISQASEARQTSVAEVKTQIETYKADFISQQKLDALRRQVVPVGEITQPMALRAPTVTGVEWDNGTLRITLDTEIDPSWAQVLQHDLGSYSAVLGIGPESFRFNGRVASASVPEESAQSAINYFRGWLPQATQRYRAKLEQALENERLERERRLQQARLAEERRIAVNQRLTF